MNHGGGKFSSLVVAASMLPTQGRRSALILAVQKCGADCVRLLLEAGADSNAEDKVRAIISAFAISGRMVVL